MTIGKRLAALERKAGVNEPLGPSVLTFQAARGSGGTDSEDMALMVRQDGGTRQTLTREPGEDLILSQGGQFDLLDLMQYA